MIRMCSIFVLFLFSSMCFAGQYMAGFAKVDISPEIGVDKLPTIQGEKQVVKQIHDPLYVKALVISDGDSSTVLISADLIDIETPDFKFLLEKLRNEEGFDHTIVTATHTHGGYYDAPLLQKVRGKILEAVSKANRALQPVKIGVTHAIVDEAYNRRIHHQDHVEMLWSNPERIQNRPVDNTLGLIDIRTMDDKRFVLLANYSAHPIVTMHLTDVVVSADYPGEFARSIMQHTGAETMFFVGACGDVNPHDAYTQPTEKALEKSKAMGETLAKAGLNQLKQIKHYESSGKLKFATHSIHGKDAELTALSLTPDIALTSFPGEYFDTLGKKLKSNSPFSYTFFIGKANGDLRYVPTKLAVDLGGFGADTKVMRVSKGDGEKHIGKAIELLNTVHNELGHL